jgi:hypothetical protein
MLAGEPLFKEATAAEVVGALLFTEPEPVTHVTPVPDPLERIVSTALRKDRESRYQSCARLLGDLRSVARMLHLTGGDAWSPAARPAGDQTSIGFVTPSRQRQRAPPRRRSADPAGGPRSRGRAMRGATRLVRRLVVAPVDPNALSIGSPSCR